MVTSEDHSILDTVSNAVHSVTDTVKQRIEDLKEVGCIDEEEEEIYKRKNKKIETNRK